MKLFEKIGDKIIVTEYFSDSKKVKEFKKKEIEKIPEDERVLSDETNTNLCIKTGRNEVDFRDLLYMERNNYHKIVCSKMSKEMKKEIISSYINSAGSLLYEPYIIKNPYEKDTVTDVVKSRIDYSNLINDKDRETLRKLKYFLTSGSYKVINNNIACMDGIINATESMYLYQLLVNDKFNNLLNKDIEEEVNLFFPFKKICEIDIKELIKNQINLKTAGIISNNTETYYDKLMTKVKESEPILKLIKK